MMFIISSIKETDTEWAQSTELGIRLLQIGDLHHKVFNGNVFVVCQEVVLSIDSEFIDENVCVCCDSCNDATNMAVNCVHFLAVFQEEMM